MTRRGMLFMCAVLLAGCRGDLDRAVDPVWGKEPCEHCKMLVSERASAAQLVTSKGDRYHFDDVGCMVQWLDEHPGVDTHGSWVRLGDGWVRATDAKYKGGARTPMDHGFVAQPDGDVTWDQLKKRVLARAEGGVP